MTQLNLLNNYNDYSHDSSDKNLITLRAKHPNNITIGYLNINSVRNKLDCLTEYLKNSLNILALAETKIDSSFPDSQFLINNMKKPYRLDVTDKKGGLLVYVDKNLPSRLLSLFKLPVDIQAIPIEVASAKQKWLIVSIYRPPSKNLKYFLSNITEMIDYYLQTYENFLILGDFNEIPESNTMKAFLKEQNCDNLIKSNTCYKSINGRCIDLILSSNHYKHKFSQHI